MKLNNMMPMGLPSTRPQNTPSTTGKDVTVAKSRPVTATSALVSANSGRMRKYTHGYNLCSRRVAGGTACLEILLRLETVVM